MPAGDRTEGVYASEHGESECDGHTREADSELREGCSQYRAAAATKNEPERAKELRGNLRVHDAPPEAERLRVRSRRNDCHPCPRRRA